MNVEGRPGGPSTSIRSGRAVVAPPVSEEVAEEVADVVVCAGVSCDESTSTSVLGATCVGDAPPPSALIALTKASSMLVGSAIPSQAPSSTS